MRLLGERLVDLFRGHLSLLLLGASRRKEKGEKEHNALAVLLAVSSDSRDIAAPIEAVWGPSSYIPLLGEEVERAESKPDRAVP